MAIKHPARPGPAPRRAARLASVVLALLLAIWPAVYPAANAQDAPVLPAGSTAYVSGTDGAGLRVHQAPDLNSPQIASLPEGAAVQVVAGPVAANNLPWYQVSAAGLIGSGWVDGMALATTPTAAAPAAAPAAPPAAAPPVGTAPAAAALPVGGTVNPGGPAWVAGTQGVGLRLHTAPALASDLVGSLADGTSVQVLEGPVGADGYEWYRIGAAGLSGSAWAAGQYLSAAPPASFAAFAGTWARHGMGLTVQPNGSATLTWRIYRWCQDDPTPPCDSMQGNLITPGGQATLEFTSALGTTAQGQVVASNVPAQWPTGQTVTLTLAAYSTAQLTHQGTATTLCGPQFGVLAPPDVLATAPCGA